MSELKASVASFQLAGYTGTPGTPEYREYRLSNTTWLSIFWPVRAKRAALLAKAGSLLAKAGYPGSRVIPGIPGIPGIPVSRVFPRVLYLWSFLIALGALRALLREYTGIPGTPEYTGIQGIRPYGPNSTKDTALRA